MASKKIVILGAGFAGLQLAKGIRNTSCDITLIDQYNFHQFQPLFYQVATARLEPSSISFPLRKVFQREKNVHVRIGKVEHVDVVQKIVVTNDCTYPYDILVIATGCTSNFFGNKNIEQYAFPMKSTTEAITIRNRILMNFEDALACTDDEREGIMNIVVVGGGPTGVEMAGALAEMKRNVLPRDYPDMNFSALTIHLLEGGPATLGAMSKPSQQKSQEYLEKLGVKVWTNALVDNYDGKTVVLKDGQKIRSNNLIWAAGVTGNIPPGIPENILVRGNRVKVNAFNQADAYPEIFALGDIAYMETPDWPKGHPQLANVAINQAKHMARNIKRMLHDKEMQPFKYKNPGTMATIGKRKAVVDLPWISFQGLLAWLFWMFLHLMLILSVKNKLIIFINWAISYFTNDTTLRLILLPTRKQIEIVEHRDIVEK